MSSGRSSRSRKQHLPCDLNNENLVEATGDINTCNSSDEPELGPQPRKKARSTTPSNSRFSEGRDKQSQLDHNEQERGRRREMAILYEMIRSRLKESDVAACLPTAGKCVEKLSYPQILSVASRKLYTEIHNRRLFDKLARGIADMENTLDRAGVNYGSKYQIPDLDDRHRTVAEVVERSLRRDKELRSNGGGCGVSQKERAKEVEHLIAEALDKMELGLLHSLDYMNRERRIGARSYASVHDRPDRCPVRRPHTASPQPENPVEPDFRNTSLNSTPDSTHPGSGCSREESNPLYSPLEEERPGSTGSSSAAAPAQFDLEEQYDLEERLDFVLDPETIRNNLDEFFEGDDLLSSAAHDVPEDDSFLQAGNEVSESLDFDCFSGSFDSLFRDPF